MNPSLEYIPSASSSPSSSPFSFKGRLGRRGFWRATGLVWLLLLSAVFLIPRTGRADAVVTAVGVVLALGCFVVGCWLGLAAHVKRWHDHDLTGGMALLGGVLGAIPIVGNVYALFAFYYLGCKRGTVGTNQYGADPVGDSAPVAPVVSV